MTIRVGISEAPGLLASPGQKIARIGVCSAGIPLQVYEFAGGQQAAVPETIGFGALAMVQERACLYGKSASLAVPAEIALLGVIDTVVQTGDGPVVTAAATPVNGDVVEGPWISMPQLSLEVVTAGVLGEARASLRYDGLTEHEIVDLPPELPASITGTVDITALSGAALTGLNGSTFIEDPDTNGPFTATFATIASYTDIVEQTADSMRTAAQLTGTADLSLATPSDINGLSLTLDDVNGEGEQSVIFGGVTLLAHIVTQASTLPGVTASLITGQFLRLTSDTLGDVSHLLVGNGDANTFLGFLPADEDTGVQYGTAALVGGKYLRITAETVGPTGTLAIGSGTANTTLGFTNGDTAEGVASTYEIPGVGVILTFAPGEYEAETVYEIPITGPRMSLAGMQAAALALRADGAPFAVLHIVHEPADGLDLAAWQAALKEITDGWMVAEENSTFVKWVIGGPLAESDAAWPIVDQDVKTNLAATQAGVKLHTIVHGDIWAEPVFYSGRHRMQLAVPYAERLALFPLNIDPGLGSNEGLDACYLKNADGSRRARTEAASTVKMQDHGFAVLKNEKQAPQVRAGRTRAPSTSQLVSEAAARAALEIARIMRELAAQYENATPPLQATGQLRDVNEAAILQIFNAAIAEEIIKPVYASSATVRALPLTTNGGADTLNLECIFQRLANIEGVDIRVFVTNKTVTVEGV